MAGGRAMVTLPLPLSQSTARLRLDALCATDYPRYRALYTDARVGRPAGLPTPADESATHAWFNAARTLPAEEGRVFALRPAQSKELIGVLRLTDWEHHACHLTLGYTLSPTAWGKGLMRECLASVLPWLFAGGLGEPIHRIQAWVLTSNTRSRRLLTWLGFQNEGTLRGLFRHPEGHEDVCCFSLLVTDRLPLVAR